MKAGAVSSGVAVPVLSPNFLYLKERIVCIDEAKLTIIVLHEKCRSKILNYFPNLAVPQGFEPRLLHL